MDLEDIINKVTNGVTISNTRGLNGNKINAEQIIDNYDNYYLIGKIYGSYLIISQRKSPKGNSIQVRIKCMKCRRIYPKWVSIKTLENKYRTYNKTTDSYYSLICKCEDK